MKDKIAYLQQKLKEGYDHYFATTDGYCKSAEGLIQVTFAFPNYFELRDDETLEKGKSDFCQIEVYSYCLGPNRMHEFTGKTFEEAYEKAKEAVDSWVDEPDESDLSLPVQKIINN